MRQCYLCNDTLTKENQSEEHIFQNAIGGKLKSRMLMCRLCNSSSGDRVDVTIAKALNQTMLVLNIKRDRGTPRRENVIHPLLGVVDLEPSGDFVPKYPLVRQNANEVSIIAPTKKHVEQIARKLCKDNDIDFKKVNFSVQERRLPIPTRNIDFYIPDISQCAVAILKTAINFYMLNKGIKSFIEHLIPIINGNSGKIKCAFYQRRNTHLSEEFVPEHEIKVKSFAKDKLLIANVNYFGLTGCIIVLNEQYDGEEYEEHYIEKLNQIV